MINWLITHQPTVVGLLMALLIGGALGRYHSFKELMMDMFGGETDGQSDNTHRSK
ncbi:hypothetical protein [Lacticaseibacillus brantae]|uniref:Uncharacterized protein n=1 Tax=Lacticaseibacillus brantae DSM 23927 TaxID=1423727 RepID=A0A0R2B0J4_9LACO|nr:hypothetical protein [Lacticaseibacillus brantae]KRM73038.1 hypothetical protein FC34_GL000759 [Lacticaseibacillus brantae DSM 23927]